MLQRRRGIYRSVMGLLASIVAYLGVVAAIILGFLMSADAVLIHSRHQATDPRPELSSVAANADSLKTKKAAKPRRHSAEVRTIPQKSTAAEYRRKAELSNNHREPAAHTGHEAHKQYWPHGLYAAAPHAMGYADERRFSAEPWR